MNGLVFIETIEDAHHFKNSVYQKDARFTLADVISLNPNIHAYLKNNEIPCLTSAEILNDKYYNAILDRCIILEGIIKPVFEKDKFDIPDYYSNTVLYYLILFWRHFLWNIELVYQSLERKEYKFISAYMHEEVKTDSQWIEDNQLYLGDIVQRYSDLKEYEFIPLNGEKVKLDLSSGSQNRIFSKCFKLILYTVYWLIVTFLLKKKTILISNPAYNMDRLCLDLKQKNKNLIFVTQGKYISHRVRLISIFRLVLNRFGIKCLDIEQPIDLDLPGTIFSGCFKEIENRQNLIIDKITNCLDVNKNEIKHRGVYFGDFLTNKIANDLPKPLTELEVRSKSVQNLLEVLRPCVVLSQMNLGPNGALGYYSSKIGIPSFLISHGSHVPHQKEHVKREHEILGKNSLYGNYGNLVAQSPFARERIISQQLNDENLVCANPILWAKKKSLNKTNNDNIFTIVHAGSLKLRHQRRLIYETSDEYVKALLEICEFIRDVDQLRLIIKSRPSDYELTESSLLALLSPIPKNVTIEMSRRIDDLLSEADLLISYSSTTIEEALVNDVPVLLYGGDGRYSHIPVKPFSYTNNHIFRPVTFVNSKVDLEKYFKILSLEYNKFKQTQLNFAQYKHKDEDTVDFIKYISEYYLK